jgi:DNA-binding HxlR family transcriptional regulator
MASAVTIGGWAPQIDRETAPETGVASLLRLLGAGASSSILLALGEGPLRTKDLTTRVPGYAPRTVYRYVGRLTEIGAIEREEEPGVPSKVVHSLTDSCGVELHDLVEAFARVSTSLERLGDGRIVPHSWGSLTLLADLWESGMFEEMNIAPCTATELARVEHDLSFHQVSRRTSLFMIGGMIRESENGNRRRHYELTEEARQATALIAGLGRWREQHVVPRGGPGLTIEETGELLRAALPLVVLPGHVGKSVRFTVSEPGGVDEAGGMAVWAEVAANGEVCVGDPQAGADGWGEASVGEWIQTLLGTAQPRIDGETPLVGALLKGMARALWPPEPASTASPA